MEDGVGDVESGALQRRQKKQAGDGDGEVTDSQLGSGTAPAAPQMMRRGGGKATQSSGGAIFVMLAFVVLVVVSWWGLMTAVMGTTHRGPKRVTPSKDAQDIIENTEGLTWDSTYAQHAGQIGWVLEDRGTQINVGFPDGTTKWYPFDALEEVKPDEKGQVKEGAHAEKKKKRKKKKGRKEKAQRSQDDDEQAGGEAKGEIHTVHRLEGDGEEAAGGEADVAKQGADATADGDAENGDGKSPPRRKHRKKRELVNKLHHGGAEEGGEQAGQADASGGDEESGRKHGGARKYHARHHRHKSEGEGDGVGSDEKPHEEHFSKAVQKHRNKHKKRKKHGAAEGENHNDISLHHAGGSGDGEEKEKEKDAGNDDAGGAEEFSEKKPKRSGGEEREGQVAEDGGKGSEGGSGDDTPAPRKHKKKRRGHRKKRAAPDGSGGGEEEEGEGAGGKPDVAHLSLASAIPKQKKACTYPSLHPHKWAEKFGWGVRKSFPKCAESGPFSTLKKAGTGGVFERADGEGPAEAPIETSIEARGKDATFQRKESSEGSAKPYDVFVAVGEDDAFAVKSVEYLVSEGHQVLRIVPRDSESDAKETRLNLKPVKARVESFANLRALLNAALVPHTIPRFASLEIDCQGTASVFGMSELPDRFFTKMQTTLDAEKRQNQLKALFTQDRMDKASYDVSDDGKVELLTHPYVVAECDGKRELHINIDAEGRKFREGGARHTSAGGAKLNVMHVMFDSSSFPALVRACPKIIKRLEDINNREDGIARVFSFKHLHAVSCCSPGNQIPMYSGRMNGEGSPFVSAEPRQKSGNWLWNIAKSIGYNTFFSLDNCPDKSSRDFQAFPSVDHRLVAPTCMAGILLSHKEKPCLTNRPIDDYVFEGLTQFWDMYPDTPKYGAVQLITPHEETEKLLIELDDPMASLLKKLEERNILNNTAVMFFSDHGINFGRYASTHDGEIEKMFPFAHLILPRWVGGGAKKGSKISFESLRSNEDALVTPYDMYQIMRELLHYPEPAPPYHIDEEDPPLPKPEQSHIVASMKTLKPFEKVLHRHVSQKRSCTDANIPPEFCTCIDWKPVDAQDYASYSEKTDLVLAEHRRTIESYASDCLPVALGEVQSMELQVWPVEYHPKEQLKAKKIWMSPNRDMMRVVYSIEARSTTRFEAIVSIDKKDKSKFDVAVITRIDAIEKKCGIVEKKAELLCVCK